MLFCTVASARPVGWMMAGGALQNGIKALQYERVLHRGFGLDLTKVSIEIGFNLSGIKEGCKYKGKEVTYIYIL